MLDLSEHKTCIFGIQGSGKTYFSTKAIEQFKRPLIYRVSADYDNIKGVYLYKPKDKTKEFNEFMDYALKLAQDKKIDCIVIDEADMFFSNNFQLKESTNELVLMHRHYKVALIFISRRPQDIPTKIVESSKHLIVFKLEGYNAIQRFKDIHPDIPSMIDQLEYKKYDYIHKEIGQKPQINEAVK